MEKPAAKKRLEKFRDCLKEKFGIEVLLEPNSAQLQEPHLRIMPVGFSLRSEEINEKVIDVPALAIVNEITFTVKLDILLTLKAMGDGPDVFLDYCIRESFKVNKAFERGFDFKLDSENSTSVIGQRREGGQFFQNENYKQGEAGQMPFLYEENFNVSLYFSYSFKEIVND